MDSALPILLFFGFLFGSTILILICGLYGRDVEEPAADAERPAALDLATLPRFFGRPGQSELAHPVMVVVDEALVARVEEFLRGELALAEVYVNDPSTERLHETPTVEEAGPSVLERLERYLRSEQQVVAGFLSNPSVESLYGRVAPLPVLV